MAQHRTLATFPPAATGYPHHRALARLHADGAVVWQISSSSVMRDLYASTARFVTL